MSISGEAPSAPPRLVGPGRLVTRAVSDLPGGGHLVLGSRQFRKGLPAHTSPQGKDHLIPQSRWLHFGRIRMRTLNEAIAVLFMVGSACFLVGGLASAFQGAGFASLKSTQAQNVVFFVGSIFFTSAAGLQLLQSIQKDLRCSHMPERAFRWWDWRPRDCGYMASLTQFVGTLLFNLNTGDPLFLKGGWLTEDVAVWTPNFVGSILFLVSSLYACVEVGHKLFTLEPRSISWWITELNLLGSICFQVSACLSLVLPGGASAEAAFLASLFTASGAVGFFLAAALLLPEQADVPSLRQPRAKA